MGSKGFRPAKPVEVKWSVTAEKTLGGLTVRRFIDLYHLVPFGGDELHQVRLNAYRAPTEKDPWWSFQSVNGETWRFQIKGRFIYEYEVWWRYEWRARSKPPRWVANLAGCIDWGKKRKLVDGELIKPEPPALPPSDDAEQLTLF